MTIIKVSKDTFALDPIGITHIKKALEYSKEQYEIPLDDKEFTEKLPEKEHDYIHKMLEDLDDLIELFTNLENKGVDYGLICVLTPMHFFLPHRKEDK
jgi:hypothetical protein